MWQIECYVPIHNAVHNARIVDNLGKFILKWSLACTQSGSLVHVVQLVHWNDPQNVWILLKNQCGLIEYIWWLQIYKYYVAVVVGSHNTM